LGRNGRRGRRRSWGHCGSGWGGGRSTDSGFAARRGCRWRLGARGIRVRSSNGFEIGVSRREPIQCDAEHFDEPVPNIDAIEIRDFDERAFGRAEAHRHPSRLTSKFSAVHSDISKQELCASASLDLPSLFWRNFGAIDVYAG
jgi:hypothetical protein